MKKLKKPAVLALLAVVLLSCVPERVQAVSVPEDEVPENAEHGTSIFTQENTLHVTYHSNRVEYDHEKVGYNIYLETPCDYCIVQFPSSKGYETQHVQYIVFITRSGTLFDPYRVDGDGGGIGNTSRTAFSSMSGLGNGEETYDCYWSVFSRDDGWFNDKEWPAPRYGHSVISMPSQFEDVDKNSLLYLLGCCEDGEFPDCRISEGDGDNPAQNAPGGIPGSESNPEYDKDIGRVVFNGNTSYYPDTYANFTGKNKEYYYNLKWEKETDTGYNLLKSPNAVCKVQFKIEPELYITYDGSKDGVEAPIESEDFSLGSFNASDLNHKFKFYDLIDKYYPTQLKLAESGGVVPGHTPNSQALKLMTFQFVYYARPIVSDSLTVIPNQTSGWKCGDWTRVVMSGTLDNVTTETDPGYFDENGDWHSDGESENIDDGRVPTDGDIDKSIDEYENGENGKHSIKDVVALLNAVSKFPLAFAKMFSFLPDWCLNLIALSFSCMMVVLLIKAVRG